MKLWLVGQYRSGEIPNVVWDFQGVFDDEENAVRACRSKNYFVWPMVLNEEYSEEPFEMDGFYPLAKQ